MRLLLIFVAVLLALPGCSVLGVESQKRNKLWEQLTAEGHAAEKEDKLAIAAQKYRAAVELATKFQASDARHSRTMISLAEVLRKQGQNADAQKLYEDALSWYEKWIGSVPPEEGTNRVGKQMTVGYLGLGRVCQAQGDLKRAKALYLKARDFGRKSGGGVRLYEESQLAHIAALEALGEKSEADKQRQNTAESIIASLDTPKKPSAEKQKHILAKQEHEAENLYSQARTKYGANESHTLFAAVNLIQHYREKGRREDAVTLIQSYLKDPAFSDQHYKAMLLNQLAGCLYASNDTAAALAAANQSLVISTNLKEQEEMAVSRFYIGMVKKENPHTRDEAISNLRFTWDVQKGYNVDPMFWQTSLALGRLYTAGGQFAEAEHVLKESILAQGGDRRETPMMADSLEALGNAYRRDNKPVDAARHDAQLKALLARMGNK